MARICILFAATALGGCVTQRSVVVPPSTPSTELSVARAPVGTHVVETRYEMRAYRDADEPGVRHEAHAVFRATRVPEQIASLETLPRTDFAPVTYAPLPPSAELAAELAMQKQITGDLRVVQARLATVERQAQSQYSALVSQTTEAMQLRRRIEEHAKAASQPPSSFEANMAQPAPTNETKW